jgi:glycosyltransferase involved in cell wall biosynthesis
MLPRILTALPVFNEERHVVEVLAEVQKFSQETLVVDDGSSDRTPQLLNEIQKLHVVRHQQNQGYGAALRTAFTYALAGQYDVLVTIDCDGQHQPALIPEMANMVFQQEDRPADIVSGSRYLKKFDGDSEPPIERRRINLQITEWLNERFSIGLTDSFCGFKAYRVDSLARFRITELGYAMPLQLWVQAAAQKMKIVEFPVPLIYLEEERSFGGSLDVAARRLAYYKEVLDREMASLQLNQNGKCDRTSTTQRSVTCCAK